MKENNEVVQGTDTALRALRANKSPCDVGAVLSVLTDTKKLNAGIALLCLENMQQSGLLSEEEFNTIAKQCERLEGLPLYNESDNEQDKTIASYAISTIEEYLKEQGV